MKIQILIDNHLRKNLVSTWHLRPWIAKHKMSVDDFSQKAGRHVHLKDTDMH